LTPLIYFISEAIALQVNNVVTNASFRPTTRDQKHTPWQLLVTRTSRQCLLGIYAAASLNRPQLVCKGTRVAYVSILLQANYNYYMPHRSTTYADAANCLSVG